MQEVSQLSERTEITENDVQEVMFCSEDQIADNIGANEWVMPCGHDCCVCDSECK